MKKRFVNLKSQLTANMLTYEGIGCLVYRTRATCDCHHHDNRRNAIFIIDPETGYVIETIIRCKGCARKEAENGTI